MNLSALQLRSRTRATFSSLIWLSLLLQLAGFVSVVSAQDGADEREAQRPLVWNPTPSRSVELFPAGELFAAYAADPHRPTNQITQHFYTRSRIPEASSPRTMMAVGGRFGMLRVGHTTPGGRSWQVGLDAGLDALFDSQSKNDALGWDGNYGLTLTTAVEGSPYAFKVAVLHMSAHMGDEYQERTGIARTNYTREEVAFAAARRMSTAWRVYGEFGIAYIMRSDEQRRGRWQGGVEYEAAPTVFGGRMAWYAAGDFSGLQERDWRLDTSLQGGLVTRSNGLTYRIFAQWYDGRPPLGQFTKYSEASLSLGLKIDL